MISDWYPSFSRCKSPQYRRTRCIYFCFPKIVFHQQVYPLRTVTEFIECKKKKKKYSRTTSFFVMLYGCRNDLKSNRDVDRKPNPSAQSSEQRPGGGVAPYVYISAIIEKGKPESFLSSYIPPFMRTKSVPYIHVFLHRVYSSSIILSPDVSFTIPFQNPKNTKSSRKIKQFQQSFSPKKRKKKKLGRN